MVHMAEIKKVGQGPAKKVEEGSVEEQKDKFGYTNPNLHRRVDASADHISANEPLPRSYELGIYNVNSYRTVTRHTHDEESETCEIP